MADFKRDYIITVANGNWNPRCSAPALVRQAGIPPSVAAAWAEVRRTISPSGLKRALKERVN